MEEWGCQLQDGKAPELCGGSLARTGTPQWGAVPYSPPSESFFSLPPQKLALQLSCGDKAMDANLQVSPGDSLLLVPIGHRHGAVGGVASPKAGTTWSFMTPQSTLQILLSPSSLEAGTTTVLHA